MTPSPASSHTPCEAGAGTMTNHISADPQYCPLCGGEDINILGVTAEVSSVGAQFGFWCARCDSNVLLSFINNGSKVTKIWAEA